MRTETEIKAKIDEKSKEMFDFTSDALLEFLPFESAKPFLKEGVTAEEWAKHQKPLTRENVVECIREYMPFALEKAKDQRGLSASRSISKMQAWLWAIGDDELVEYCETNYKPYGMPALKAIEAKYLN